MFCAFTEKEASSLSHTNEMESKQSFGERAGEYGEIRKTSSINNSIAVKENKCILCNQRPQLFKCQKFNSMNVNER